MLNHLSRNARIDLLRGVAILLVLLLHFHLSYPLDQTPWLNWVPISLLQMLLVNGNYGVTMFFVISGFLITSITQKRWGKLGQVDWLGFYVNRLARIMPPLLFALVVIIALGCAGISSFTHTDGGHHLPLTYFFSAVFSVLTFWHNLLMQKVGYFNYALNIYWSLSVEEMFYLCFPIMCLLLKRQQWILLACAILIIVGPLYRAHYADNELYFMYGYWACFDAIAIGVATALLAPRVPQLGWHVKPMQWAALILLGFTFWQGIHHHEILGFSQIALSTTTLLLFATGDEMRGYAFNSLAARSLRFMGQHSYELYLFHIIVLGLLRAALPAELITAMIRPLGLLAYILVSTLLAVMISRSLAEPVNQQLRARFVRWRSARLTPTRERVNPGDRKDSCVNE